MRRFFCLSMVFGVCFLAGCGGGKSIWVTGVLQKAGEPYKAPEGRKLALYFCPIGDGATGVSSGDLEMADYNEKDGTFTVPGREGYGIPPGKYRIAVIETLRRETLDRLNKASKPKRGQKRLDDETNFLEGTFGETTSPFVRDLQASTNLTLDMSKPTD